MIPVQTAPLSFQEFAWYMNQVGPIEKGSPVAVATSGGPDSLSLAILAAQWAASHHSSLTALIVDHGLRAESPEEAHLTSKVLDELQINNKILKWEGAKPTSRIQERAREARYKILTDWCRQHNCRHLLVGHHLKDQQETILWRALRGSNLWGMAGMSARIERAAIIICRPLLAIAPQRLQATLRHYNIKAINDPSNYNEKFSRVAIRNRLDRMPDLPCTRFQELRQSLERWCQSFTDRYIEFSQYGFISLEHANFCLLSFPFQEFLLNHLSKEVAPRPFPLPSNDLKRLAIELRKPMFKPRTIGGCVFFMKGKNLVIAREWHAIKKVAISDHLLDKWICWDHCLRLKCSKEDYILAPIGETGWQQLCQQGCAHEMRAIPYYARLALPALWKERKIVALIHFPAALQSSDKLFETRFEGWASFQSSGFRTMIPFLPA